ncbi:ABC transporter substrate-binding protein [Ktedonobacter robiniae]|uniref:Peptide ABC transporter substrate-binding protein n=1 Tax=Ktedonobacter robiniae TaxID=2778365 RepID=A0ABQ3UH36_9CHLR|nr:ABC transporter substrate-binding protein [Ktedonobacter robiniae]GHO51890.1 peptide ABC transporter substrate-binding protein [Ktedonobacter robiniae]
MFTTLFRAVSRRQKQGGMLVLSLAMLLTLLLTACGGSGSSTQKADSLWIGQVGDQYTQNFNPYTGASGGPPSELIYETLLFTNYANGTMNPWLATAYKFSPDNKQLTFTLRDNVKWNDGKPFTASDVAFTFNLMHKYSGLDVSNIWKYLTKVTAPDTHTIVLDMSTPYTPLLWYLGRLQILPEHIWSSVGDPTKYTASNPVGTGPFKLGSFSSQVVTLDKNPYYWQSGQPAFAHVKYPIYKSNDTLQLQLISGKLDQANVFAPNIQKSFVARDPEHNHYWLVPNQTVMFYPNNAKAPFNDVAVRQAISAALDREKMSKVAENGYQQVASPTALILPNAKSYLAPEYANLKFQRDVQKARQLLESAGYTRGGDGIYAKGGQRLSFKISVPNTYSDEILLAQIASDNLKEAGMDASVNTLSYTDWYNNKQLGQYDITIDNDGGGLNPYYYFNRTLYSKRSAPIGANSLSNFGRWEDASTDKYLDQFAASSDPNIQKQAIYGLEKIFVEKMPTIPLLDAPTWFIYNSSRFDGWPSAQNPFTTAASPLQVTLHLKPR